MFTGIIETIAKVVDVKEMGSGRTFQLSSTLVPELKVDQSLSHNGVCLTVEAVSNGSYQVTAVHETLQKTNLSSWNTGTLVNLERCMQLNARLDGHIVQGHVDTTAACIGRKEMDGSWHFRFSYPDKFKPLVIEKGSICLNGISLTVFGLSGSEFSVAVIPYTFEHTNINTLESGDTVNIEFDVIGKYITRLHSLNQ